VFARAALIKVEPGCRVELTRTLEQEVIPLFRKEKDFRGLFAFTFPNGTKALSLSLWDQKENAGGICARGVGALAALAKVALETLSVQVYEVSTSTLHTMEEMLGQGEGVEAIPDLKVYQACARTFPIAARTVHAELRFPASVASYEFPAEGNPIPGRRSRTRTSQQAIQE